MKLFLQKCPITNLLCLFNGGKVISLESDSRQERARARTILPGPSVTSGEPARRGIENTENALENVTSGHSRARRAPAGRYPIN